MDKKIIHFSNKKSNRRLLLATGMVLVTGALWGISLRADAEAFTVISGILLGGAATLDAVQLVRTLTRPKAGLELDHEGLRFNGSSVGRKIGKISWQDIQAFQTGTFAGKKALLIKFIHPQTTTRGIELAIHAKALNINFYEMETLFLHFYHRYHERKTTA